MKHFLLAFLALCSCAFAQSQPRSSSGTPSSITDGTATVSTSGGNITNTTGTTGSIGIYGGQLQANDKPIAINATGTNALVSGSGTMTVGWDGIRPKLSWGGSTPAVNIVVPADLSSYVSSTNGAITTGTIIGAPSLLATVPVASGNVFSFGYDATDVRFRVDPWNTTIRMHQTMTLGWSTSVFNLDSDTSLYRVSGGVMGLTGTTTSFALAHTIGKSGAPSIAVGAGAGTGASASIVGTDTDGTITINSGTLPAISAVAVTVTYSAGYAYPTTSVPVIWPANTNAATLGFLPFVSGGASTFTINTAAVSFGGSTTYTYNYHIGGY